MKKTYRIGIYHHDAALHFKFHYIIQYEGRSANRHILYLIRKNIAAYEAKYGEIKMPDPDNE